MRKIIVGSDGSGTAEEAVRQAVELARILGGELIIVRATLEPEPRDSPHAYEPTLDDAVRDAGLPGDVAHAVGPRAQAAADLEAEVAAAAEAGVQEVSSIVRRGEPAEVIIAIAEEQEADLIVVGNKGMTGAARFLLGSVPNKITHHAPCDVLVVRTT